MPDEIRSCASCSSKFLVTEKELSESRIPAPGLHDPKDCPEGLDGFCPKCDSSVYGPDECPGCRPKQDQQRN